VNIKAGLVDMGGTLFPFDGDIPQTTGFLTPREMSKVEYCASTPKPPVPVNNQQQPQQIMRVAEVWRGANCVGREKVPYVGLTAPPPPASADARPNETRHGTAQQDPVRPERA
jgi:hypothetical protein